jgi:hypothetical protein
MLRRPVEPRTPERSEPERAAPEVDNEAERDENRKPSTQAGQIEQIASLLRGDEPDERESDEQDTGDPGESRKPKGKPKNLAELAERLGVKVEDLYAVEFMPASQGGTKAVTLGELKDLHAKQSDFDARALRSEEDRTRREGELMRAQAEMNELLASLPKNVIKPEILEQVRRKHETRLQSERARTLDVLPDWKDDAKRVEEMSGIVEHLKGYGFPANYLASIYDHRSLKYIRENWLREKRIREALEKVKEVKPQSTSKSRSNGGKAPERAATQPNRRTGARATVQGQVSAIAALLKNH